jgi:L-threonylcarbamoyladenylate synthase
VTATRVIAVDAAAPDPAVLRDAAETLRRGGLVAFPTETFYGLGAAGLDAWAVGRLVAVKGRPEGKPILLLVDSVAMVEAVAVEIGPTARALMGRHWPGPLTLVLRARAELPPEVTAGTGTVGVRVSPHPVAGGLVRALGGPVTAPSANPSGESPPSTAAAVLARLDGRIDLLLDGGGTPGGEPSTVLDVTVEPPRVLRAGAVRPWG